MDQRGNITLETAQNSSLQLAVLSVLGDRSEQQDCFGFDLRGEGGFVVVADGMGGHEGGKLAGKVAVVTLLEEYSQMGKNDGMELLLEAMRIADRRIYQLENPRGQRMKAGSTAVLACIRDGKLMWCSVGDSRAYLLRRGELVCLTRDHNYRAVLDQRLERGLMTREEYQRESAKGGALISFLGLGKLELMDYSATPFPLEREDRVLLLSDGLYKCVSEQEVLQVLECFSDVAEAVQELERRAQKNAQYSAIYRDNLTVALIKIR